MEFNFLEDFGAAGTTLLAVFVVVTGLFSQADGSAKRRSQLLLAMNVLHFVGNSLFYSNSFSFFTINCFTSFSSSCKISWVKLIISS